MSFRKQLLALFILAIASMSFFSCTKKKDTTPSAKSFYVKLDGTAFEPTHGGRYYAIDSAGGGGIQIVGDDATTTVELRLTAATVGTYALGTNDTGNNYASVYYNSGGREYISSAGEVKITKADGAKISGTFRYTATGSAGTIMVTAGEFNNIPKM